MKITDFKIFDLPVFFFNFGPKEELESTLIISNEQVDVVRQFEGIASKLNIYILRDGGLVKFEKEELNSAAVKLSSAIQNPGGIDLTPRGINLEIKGKGANLALPVFSAISFDPAAFQGFTFQILSIKPAGSGLLSDWQSHQSVENLQSLLLVSAE